MAGAFDDANSTKSVLSYIDLSLCLEENYFGFYYTYFILSLCFLVGTPAHSWSLWFYLYVDGKTKPIQVFALHLTMMEFTMCLYCIIKLIDDFVLINDAFTSVGFFLFGLSWIGKPLIQACICMEQYMAVIHPVVFLKYKDIKNRIAVAALAWLLATGYGVFVIYSPDFPDDIFTSVFVITVIVIMFCCSSVLLALKHPGPGDPGMKQQAGGDVGNQQKRNAFKTILMALIMTVCSALPQALLRAFALLDVSWMYFQCYIVPVVNSINFILAPIPALLKMYKEGYLQCKILK